MGIETLILKLLFCDKSSCSLLKLTGVFEVESKNKTKRTWNMLLSSFLKMESSKHWLTAKGLNGVIFKQRELFIQGDYKRND
jgi:hypothetical protein